MQKNSGNTVIVLGVIASLLFFIGGIIILISGLELTSLRSVGGRSVAESYYQEMGKHGIAYSLSSFAFAFLSLSISIGIGNRLKLLDEPGSKKLRLNKKCPSCAEIISLESLVCPYCKNEFQREAFK